MKQQNRRQFLATSSAAFGAMTLGLSACGEGGEEQESAVGGGGVRNANYVYGDVVLGDPAATVEIMEYASLTCPACAYFHANIYPEFKEKYIEPGKIRFIFRNFVFNQTDLMASMVCRSGGNDRFYDLISLVFSQQPELLAGDPATAISSIVRKAGISRSQVEAALKDQELQKALIAFRNEASRKYAVHSTPTFLVNRDAHIQAPRNFEEFDSALRKHI